MATRSSFVVGSVEVVLRVLDTLPGALYVGALTAAACLIAYLPTRSGPTGGAPSAWRAAIGVALFYALAAASANLLALPSPWLFSFVAATTFALAFPPGVGMRRRRALRGGPERTWPRPTWGACASPAACSTSTSRWKAAPRRLRIAVGVVRRSSLVDRSDLRPGVVRVALDRRAGRQKAARRRPPRAVDRPDRRRVRGAARARARVRLSARDARFAGRDPAPGRRRAVRDADRRPGRPSPGDRVRRIAPNARGSPSRWTTSRCRRCSSSRRSTSRTSPSTNSFGRSTTTTSARSTCWSWTPTASRSSGWARTSSTGARADRTRRSSGPRDGSSSSARKARCSPSTGRPLTTVGRVPIPPFASITGDQANGLLYFTFDSYPVIEARDPETLAIVRTAPGPAFRRQDGPLGDARRAVRAGRGGVRHLGLLGPGPDAQAEDRRADRGAGVRRGRRERGGDRRELLHRRGGRDRPGVRRTDSAVYPVEVRSDRGRRSPRGDTRSSPRPARACTC